MRFELQVAAFGCTSANSSGLPLSQNGNPGDTDAFVIRGHWNQTIMAAGPGGRKVRKSRLSTLRRRSPETCRGPASSLFEGLLQFFTGAPQFFRMKRLSARLLYSVTQEFLTKVN